MVNVTKGNFWKNATASLVLAFAAVAGVQQLAIHDLSSQAEKDRQKISTLWAASTYASTDATIRVKDSTIGVLHAATRSVDHIKDEDYTGISFITRTAEGINVSNSVGVSAATPTNPNFRLDFYKTALLEKLAARAERGVSACDLVKQPDYMLPEFAEAKRAFLDANGDPAQSLAKTYKTEVPAATKTALDALKASGSCKM
ncbi:MAG: hypothetical protein ACAH83_16725 [Alphaproteobacteria bacterium]